MELTNRLDAATIAARVAAGRLDPAEVVAAFQARIAARNDQLNAVFEQRQELVDADLARLRARLAQGERPLLAGVPVIVKDVIWSQAAASRKVRSCTATSSPADASRSSACARPARSCSAWAIPRSSPARA